MARKVLLVDDDPHIQELIKFFLKSSGLNLIICNDGYAALNELQNKKFDLVILDISMPHMNGFQTLRTLRQHSVAKNTPVIMLTGSKDKTDVVKALKLGITDFILKPPTKEDFVARVEKIVGSQEDNISVNYSDDDESVKFETSLVLQLKSVSSKTLVLISSIALPLGFRLSLSEMQLFKQLDLETVDYSIGESLSVQSGKFEYAVQLENLTQRDEQKIKLWLKTNANLNDK